MLSKKPKEPVSASERLNLLLEDLNRQRAFTEGKIVAMTATLGMLDKAIIEVIELEAALTQLYLPKKEEKNAPVYKSSKHQD